MSKKVPQTVENRVFLTELKIRPLWMFSLLQEAKKKSYFSKFSYALLIV